MSEKRSVIIDTDPGIDDAVAIAIAAFSDELDIKLITTVAGNVSLDLVTENALKLMTFFGKDIPVAKGAGAPFIKTLETASNVHGESGMDGYDFGEPDRTLLLKEHAVNAMRSVILNSRQKVTLMPIAPLTNIALLLTMYPEVRDNIEQIVFMGGSLTRGNKGVMSEFNIDLDPEAAKIVFKSGLPMVMAGLDMGLKALVYPQDRDKIKTMNKTGGMICSLFQKYRGGSYQTGLKMYDSCAVAYLLCPEIFETGKYFVDVETRGEFTAGCTIVDIKGYLKQKPNMTVCTDLREDTFKEWFLHAISKCI